MKKFFKKVKGQKGFTILELMITIFIFAMMTAFLLAKYGKFDQSVLLTNLAYDVALTIRNAQSYGLNVKSLPETTTLTEKNAFNYPFGAHFVIGTSFNFFADLGTADHVYTSDTESITPYIIRKNMSVDKLCAGNSADACSSATSLDITFKRPDPNAIITINGSGLQTYPYAEIILKSSDNSTRKVVVRSTGQISIEN